MTRLGLVLLAGVIAAGCTQETPPPPPRAAPLPPPPPFSPPEAMPDAQVGDVLASLGLGSTP